MEEITNTVKPHNITLKARSCMTITGVCEIISFDENCISLDISDFSLNIEGTGLKIDSFSNETGDVVLTGFVDAIIYVGKAHETYRRGLFKRIFSYDDR